MNAIRAARIDAHLSQTQLAFHVGVSKQAVWKWEHGVQHPGRDNAWRLCAALPGLTQVEIYAQPVRGA
jgi:DNA-binding XRE family transcriptional regulator